MNGVEQEVTIVPTLPGYREKIEVLRLALVAGGIGTMEWNAETGLLTADAVCQTFSDVRRPSDPGA
jgi:hypothetical protein